MYFAPVELKEAARAYNENLYRPIGAPEMNGVRVRLKGGVKTALVVLTIVMLLSGLCMISKFDDYNDAERIEATSGAMPAQTYSEEYPVLGSFVPPEPLSSNTATVRRPAGESRIPAFPSAVVTGSRYVLTPSTDFSYRNITPGGGSDAIEVRPGELFESEVVPSAEPFFDFGSSRSGTQPGVFAAPSSTSTDLLSTRSSASGGISVFANPGKESFPEARRSLHRANPRDIAAVPGGALSPPAFEVPITDGGGTRIRKIVNR